MRIVRWKMVTRVVRYICDKCDLDFDYKHEAERHQKECDAEWRKE